MTRKDGTGRVCVGTLCFCDRCLYVCGVAVLLFAISTPAAIISHDSGDWTLTVALGVVAAISLVLIAFSLIVNFLAAWRKHHYYSLKHTSR